MNTIKVALVGQPNVGKSLLINSISNSKLKVGNFSGVTVEKTEVIFEYCDDISCQNYKINMVDLPGVYSLSDYTLEEKVTKNFLLHEEYDLILNVVDSTNLDRNLLLSAELFELDRKVIIALNMSDEAKKEGIDIDNKQLSTILGVPCIKVSAINQEGIDELIHAIIKLYKSNNQTSKLIYSDTVEEEIENITTFLKEKRYKSSFSYRHIAIRLLQEDQSFYKMLHDEPIWIELLPILRDSLNHLYIHYDTKDTKEIFLEERVAFVKGAITETIKYKTPISNNLTSKIDSILIHKFFGIPIFLFFMWSMFQLTFELGSIPQEWIDHFFTFIADSIKSGLGNSEFSSLLADGIVAGVGAVVMFLPNIVILFLGIALLESTGYMSRVAFLLDGFFHKFGLHGKSFIPLVTGFGCSVPAYMAARTLKNEKDRLITLFIIGFMSCGARMPVYVLFAGAFFSANQAGNVLFIIYISGAILGLIAAKILKTFIFKGDDEPFVMEMPKYRLPSLKLIWHTVFLKSMMYLKKAGTYILAASLLIWFASNYPKYPELEKEYHLKIENSLHDDQKIKLENELQTKLLENSYLGIIGKSTSFLFEPLGFDWKMTVALESGLAAKEIIVSTLSILYQLGDKQNETNESLINAIKSNIPFASAISFIVFVMIYLPCLAASMVFVKEAGKWKYLGYLFIFTTLTAWILAFVAYHITLIFT